MKKDEIIAYVSARSGVPRAGVRAALAALVECTKESLAATGKASIPDLASLKMKDVKARPASERPNPFKPSEKIVTKARPAGRAAKVSLVGPFRAAVNTVES